MKSSHKGQKIRISTVGAAILVALATTGIVLTFAVLPGLAVIVGPFIKSKKPNYTQAVKRNLDSLIQSGLVKRVHDSKGNEQLIVTKKGRWEAALRHSILDEKKEKWDGLWRVIIFDVPVAKNALRNELRRAVKLFGFRSLQKSVWVYPHTCHEFVMLVKSHLGVSHDVLYMEVSSIENDKFLRKEFEI